jgi:hypothetical protein
MKGDNVDYALRLREHRGVRGLWPLADSARPNPASASRFDKKWSPRRTLVFIVGVSVTLWAAIICLCAQYL